jgi:hypothetical protein
MEVAAQEDSESSTPVLTPDWCSLLQEYFQWSINTDNINLGKASNVDGLCRVVLYCRHPEECAPGVVADFKPIELDAIYKGSGNKWDRSKLLAVMEASDTRRSVPPPPPRRDAEVGRELTAMQPVLRVRSGGAEVGAEGENKPEGQVKAVALANAEAGRSKLDAQSAQLSSTELTKVAPHPNGKPLKKAVKAVTLGRDFAKWNKGGAKEVCMEADLHYGGRKLAPKYDQQTSKCVVTIEGEAVGVPITEYKNAATAKYSATMLAEAVNEMLESKWNE